MAHDPFIDQEIARARTLPSFLYHDADAFARQRERVFAASWQYAIDAPRLKAPGHVVPFTLLEGCLDEPLVATRDRDGRAHCFSNVCTHRGALVVEGEQHASSLRCRYHGRRFGLDGCFQFMPEFDGTEGFPSADDDLPRLPLEGWGPLLFTALRAPCSFEAWIEPVRERVSWLPLDRLVYDPATSREYLIEANWALYCDNYLEGFHIPYVHQATLTGALDYDSYRTELFPWGSLQLGEARPGESAFDPPEGHPEHGRRVAAYYFWLYPNLMLNFYPWGLSVNVVRPLGPSRTRVSFYSWVSDASLRDLGAGGALDRVEMEDEEIVESVQRGVRSRLYDRGRYSPLRETGVHHFHRLLAASLSTS